MSALAGDDVWARKSVAAWQELMGDLSERRGHERACRCSQCRAYPFPPVTRIKP